MSTRLQKIRQNWPDDRLEGLPGLPYDTRISPVRIFQAVVDADPTPNHKYVDWTLRAWERRAFRWEDICEGSASRVSLQLSRFFKHCHMLPNAMRSLMKYRSPGELDAAMDEAGVARDVSDFDLSSNQQKKLIMQKARLESVHFDTPSGMQIDIPLTLYASQILGRNTRWCTAAKTGSLFYDYSATGALLIFTLPGGERFQGHIPVEEENDISTIAYALGQDELRNTDAILRSISLMDENDTPIQKSHFKSIGPYFDDIMETLLTVTARAAGITQNPETARDIITAYRAFIHDREPVDRLPPGYIGPMIIHNGTHLKSHQEHVETLFADIRSRLEKAGHLKGDIILNPCDFKQNGPADTVIQSALRELTDEYDTGRLTGHLTTRNFLGGLKLDATFLDGMADGKNRGIVSDLCDLNVFRDLFMNNLDEIVSSMERVRDATPVGKSSLARQADWTNGFSHINEFPDAIIDRLRQGLLHISVMIDMDMRHLIRKAKSEVCISGDGISVRHAKKLLQEVFDTFCGKYQAYPMDSTQRSIALGKHVLPSFMKCFSGVKNGFCDFSVGGETFKRCQGVISGINMAPYVKGLLAKNEETSYSETDFIRITGAHIYHAAARTVGGRFCDRADIIQPVQALYKSFGLSGRVDAIVNTSTQNDADRRALLSMGLEIGRQNKEVGPGHKLFYLTEVTNPDNGALNSWTQSFLRHYYPERSKSRHYYSKTIQTLLEQYPIGDITQIMETANLSSIIIAPDATILDEIQKDIHCAKAVAQYQKGIMERDSEAIRLLLSDTQIVEQWGKLMDGEIKKIETFQNPKPKNTRTPGHMLYHGVSAM